MMLPKLLMTILFAEAIAGCLGPRKVPENASVVFNIEGIEKLDPQTQVFKIEVVKLPVLDALAGEVEKSLNIEIKSELEVSNIKSGPTEFKISVVGKADAAKVYYYGGGRHQVRPGSQKMDNPIVLKKVDFQGDLITLPVRVTLSLAGAQAVPVEITAEAKAVVEKGNCKLCHNQGSASSEFHFEAFPYKSKRSGLETLPKVIEKMAMAIDPALDPQQQVKNMPPADNLTPDDKAAFTAWYKSVSATNNVPGEIATLGIDRVTLSFHAERFPYLSGEASLTQKSPGVFEGTMANIPTGENIVATLTVAKGQVLYLDKGPLAVIKPVVGQTIEYSAEVANQDGSVDIDVEIE
jgi:hypothetical protein